MSPTTRRIHEMSFRVVDCDIPPELTLPAYRRTSAPAAPRRRLRLGRRKRQ
jgi:hypothetical protein